MPTESTVHVPSPPLQFYFNRNCPYAQRTWITLLELQVNCEFCEIELGKDNHTDWFRSLNPNGTVPVIKHGQTVVYESLVVNEYLCEVFGNDSINLMPKEPALRSRARILISRCDSKFVKLSYSYLSHKCNEAEEDSVAKDEQLRTQLEDELRFLDSAIGELGGHYFMGEKVSLVDIAFIPFFERMLVALATWKNFEITCLQLGHLNTWLEAMSKRDTYTTTRTPPERIQELYSRFLCVDYFKRAGVTQ